MNAATSAGQRYRRYDSKPPLTELSCRDADDVQQVTVLELDQLAGRIRDDPYDAVEEHLVCQIQAARMNGCGAGAVVSTGYGLNRSGNCAMIPALNMSAIASAWT